MHWTGCHTAINRAAASEERVRANAEAVLKRVNSSEEVEISAGRSIAHDTRLRIGDHSASAVKCAAVKFQDAVNPVGQQ